MSSLLKDVGAVAGLASFVGLALLALLYFAQARDARRLRESANFFVEGSNEDGESVTPAERTATAVAAKEPRRPPRPPRTPRPAKAEGISAGRARPARPPSGGGASSNGAGAREWRLKRPAWLSDWKYLPAIIVGTIVLLSPPPSV